jgi:L-fuculose-phosphate aldolase
VSEIDHLDIRQKIIATCLEMTKQGINQGTAGNVSYRIEDGLLITPTSLPYEVMTPEDIVHLKWDGSFTGRHRPSSEWRFHRDILKNREDVNVVLHNHATYTTVLATHERSIPPFHYMTAVAGGHDIRVSKYAPFGTQELSDEILVALKDRYACIMGHHGMLTTGKSLDKALALAIEVETLAKMYVHALAIGEPPHLPAEEMDRVIEQMRRMSYGNAPDLDHVKDTPKSAA